MLTFLIILALAIGFYIGFRRGLAFQLIRTIGFVLSFVIAGMFFRPLSNLLEIFIPFPSIQPHTELAIYNETLSFFINDAFYNVLAYFILQILVLIVTHILTILLRPIKYIPLATQFNHLTGGLLNALLTYIMIFIVLFIFSLIPIEWIQQQFVDNPLAYAIVTNTPILSQRFADLWFNR